jgi:hypothetical protein
MHLLKPNTTLNSKEKIKFTDEDNSDSCKKKEFKMKENEGHD